MREFNMCKNNKLWDNGYLYGYFCELTGNKCDCEEIEIICPAYEESEKALKEAEEYGNK